VQNFQWRWHTQRKSCITILKVMKTMLMRSGCLSNNSLSSLDIRASVHFIWFPWYIVMSILKDDKKIGLNRAVNSHPASACILGRSLKFLFSLFIQSLFGSELGGWNENWITNALKTSILVKRIDHQHVQYIRLESWMILYGTLPSFCSFYCTILTILKF
jgi:hypothetical protein